MTYQVTLSHQARRALNEDLPVAAAFACAEFLSGPLAGNPQRVGKQLRGPLEGLYSARRGQFRIIYSIHEDTVVVHVVNIRHRRDAYRT